MKKIILINHDICQNDIAYFSIMDLSLIFQKLYKIKFTDA